MHNRVEAVIKSKLYIRRKMTEVLSLFPEEARRDRALTLESRVEFLWEVFQIMNSTSSPKWENLKILDVGCGSGEYLLFFKLLGLNGELYGLNIGPLDRYGEAYDSKWDEGRGKIHYKECNIDRGEFGFKDEYFDVILCTDVIEHLYHPKRALNEMYRVLRKNGKIFIITPNLATLKNRVLFLFGKSVYPSINEWFEEGRSNWVEEDHYAGHIREYTMRELEYMLTQSNFKVIRKRYMKHSLAGIKVRYGRFAAKLYSLVTTVYPNFRYILFVAARKC